MQGSGNDFVLLNNDQLKIRPEDMSQWATQICRRSFGVGGDGLIFLESSSAREDEDVRWHFYNADGSRAEMCGNGSRCAAMLAYRLNMAPASHVLGTDAGPVKVEVKTGSGEVNVELTPPQGLELNLRIDLDQEQLQVHFVDTGVPHAVLVTSDAAGMDISRYGPGIRHHPRFSPKGANVNLVQVRDRAAIDLRTYERGVEGETFACGTGAVASALIGHELGLLDNSVDVRTSGGESLRIALEPSRVFLQGPAVLVYAGELDPAAVGLKQPL
jgi:diaminopimelate epimerase